MYICTYKHIYIYIYIYVYIHIHTYTCMYMGASAAPRLDGVPGKAASFSGELRGSQGRGLEHRSTGGFGHANT